jgi:hypothetical protein
MQMRKEIRAGNQGTSAKEHAEVMQRFFLANASNNGSG